MTYNSPELYSVALLKRRQNPMQISINEGIYYLGALCHQGHEHEGTGQSLRYKTSRHCWHCSKSRNGERRAYMRTYQWRKRGLPAPTRPEPEVCDICDGIGRRALALDHDHNTGEFRGWLCDNCNRALGQLGDNIEGLKKALDYLEKAAL